MREKVYNFRASDLLREFYSICYRAEECREIGEETKWLSIHNKGSTQQWCWRLSFLYLEHLQKEIDQVCDWLPQVVYEARLIIENLEQQTYENCIGAVHLFEVELVVVGDITTESHRVVRIDQANRTATVNQYPIFAESKKDIVEFVLY